MLYITLLDVIDIIIQALRLIYEYDENYNS